MRFACLLRSILLAGVVAAAACSSKGSGGVPITTCPASSPTASVPCSGAFNCTYQVCSCHGCCPDLWNCVPGYLMGTDVNNTCSLGPPCTDGGAGSGGGSGGAGGAGGGTGGAGGGTGGSGGITLSSCPPSEPKTPLACTGSFACRYTSFCTCHGCCSTGWRCTNGVFQISGLDADDGCIQQPCPDGGAVCTFGADQTCNDSPLISSIHGHCTDAGVCECTFDAGTNPDSGRCY